ncbi:MAG TPA: hypothetical protein VF265_01685 [Nevskiaceae bacterium]
MVRWSGLRHRCAYGSACLIATVALALMQVAIAQQAPLCLGELKVVSAEGAPLHAVIPLCGSVATPTVRVAAMVPAGMPLNATVDPDTEPPHVTVTSSRPLPSSGLDLRVQINAQGQAFAATYSVRTATGTARDHAWAGQVAGQGRHGWYGIESAAPGLLHYEQLQLMFGPTRPGDTLENIAKEIAPRLNQAREKIAVALFEANRQHFNDEDPRRLRSGTQLVVPDPVTVELVPPQTAHELHAYLTGTSGNNPLAAAQRPAAAPLTLPERVWAWAQQHAEQLLRWLVPILIVVLLIWLLGALWRRRHPPQVHTAHDSGTAGDQLSPEAIRQAQILRLQERYRAEPDDTVLGMRLAREYYMAARYEDFERLAKELRPRLSDSQRERLAKMMLEPDSP